jgi:hypothetical protein
MFTLFKSEQLDKEARDAGVDRVLLKTEINDLETGVERLSTQ